MQFALELCRRYARADRPVVLIGPVGSGKSSLATYIHEQSGRAGPLIAVSGGELVDTLYADTLFGHVSGAFTGARGLRPGAFERAAGGTLFLDDLACMCPPAQAALLRATEDRRFTPLGAVRDVPVTCREVYATTVAPAELVVRGQLLSDLESRLGELRVYVPTLVERRDDILDLAVGFCTGFLTELHRPRRLPLSSATADCLLAYGWPGNVRELKGVIEHAVLHAVATGSNQIEVVHLPTRFAQAGGEGASAPRRLRPDVVRHTVAMADGNQSEAARRLGVHRNTIARYLRKDHKDRRAG